jgi:hypothetical protein
MRVIHIYALCMLLGWAGLTGASVSSSNTEANPIRKVVTLLQDMSKEIAAEGEKEKGLYDAYMCYCQTTEAELGDSASKASANIDEVTAKLEEDSASKATLDQELATHKSDRAAATTELDKATAIRNREAEEFAADDKDNQANLDGVAAAIPALEKGMGAASLMQVPGMDRVKHYAESSASMNSFDRDNVVAFLEQRANGDYVPQSGQIVGILKTMKEDMEKNIAEAKNEEAGSATAFSDLKAAKEKEIAASSEAIESKTVTSGELAVAIVQHKDAQADAEEELRDSQVYLAGLKKACEEQQKAWTVRQSMRAEEVSAISEAISILNDDDALDIFKKSLPSAFVSVGPTEMGFLQPSQANKNQRLQKAHALLQNAAQTYRDKPLALLSYAIASKLRVARRSGAQEANFDVVVKLLDNMVAHLGNEGKDDKKHKEYCEAELAKSADEQKSVKEDLVHKDAAISELKDEIATLGDEIETLKTEIIALDGSVATATVQRKNEAQEFTQMMTLNEAAVQLIDKAKNRLNKFYNPAVYKAPPKKELSDEEAIMSNAGFSLVQVQLHHAALNKKGAPPPPPASFDAYANKGDKSTGVVALMDMLAKELKDDMANAEHDEKMAVKEYEELMADSATSRQQNAKTITNKEAAKATLGTRLEAAKEAKMLTGEQVMTIAEMINTLHGSCDFIMENFDLRKEARANEVESLKNAKAVLAGASFSL